MLDIRLRVLRSSLQKHSVHNHDTLVVTGHVIVVSLLLLYDATYISTAYAVMWCLSVTFMYSVETNKHIFKTFFTVM